MDNKAKERERLKLNGAIRKYLADGGTIKKLEIQSEHESSENRFGIDDFESNEDIVETDLISFNNTIKNRKPEQIQ